MTTNTVRIRPVAASASGRRTGWLKHVTSVDATKANGYAFAGDFLQSNREVDLPIGAVVLSVEPRGSVKNGWKAAIVYQVEADGSLAPVTEPADWRDDFLSIRDAVQLQLEDGIVPANPHPLAEFTDAEIVAEAKRRGLTMKGPRDE